ncbi:glutamate racemase [uncultured Croceitalea sp.]|uniref:glutamate racemase n=1 Tax=uncultured Croceitalea sp. TaxID=1798908 RepID=UPI003306806F
MDNPIGIFDSGVGGTSIWKAIHQLLPNEQTIYLADSKNAPYGEKTKNEILELSIKNTEFLLNGNCKLIVVACNTATTNAIDFLRTSYKVPFIGIEPAIKPAALQTKTKKVGVLATKGTLSSSLFHSTSRLYAEGIEVIEQEGQGLVELIEAGKVNSQEIKSLLQNYLQPMLKANVDCLVLGCTHYPYLIKTLRELLPDTVKIIDSGEAVARQTKAVLEKHGIRNVGSKVPQENVFYSNSDISVLKGLLGEGSHKVQYLDF